MRAEWGEDEAVASAATHRAALVDGLRRVRSSLDEFDPDVVSCGATTAAASGRPATFRLVAGAESAR